MRGKNVLLGITGSIAAYKAASLVRLLVQEGAEVQVVMTTEDKEFITPLTLATLSKRPVISTYFQEESGVWNNHVDWALWADVLLIAPLTANTMAKMAHGQCDNFLLGIYLSARSPVYIAPAMDLDMWTQPATRANLTLLIQHGVNVVSPGTGELASGLIGAGRMAEPEELFHVLKGALSAPLPLAGKRVLVTAGPTYEAIDPVRFIGNHSSGKMGYALASVFARLGAEVTLVHGPTALSPIAGVTHVGVVSAEEMLQACLVAFVDADITVMSAAVADYRPKQVAAQKIKKSADDLRLELEKTQDILATLGAIKKDGQMLVGFALETENELLHAKDKLVKKRLDYIVLNSMRDPGAGFSGDTNKVCLINEDGIQWESTLQPKEEIAKHLVEKLVAHYTK